VQALFLDDRLTDGNEVVSLTRRPHFTVQGESWYSFLLEAESTLEPYSGLNPVALSPQANHYSLFLELAEMLVLKPQTLRTGYTGILRLEKLFYPLLPRARSTLITFPVTMDVSSEFAYKFNGTCYYKGPWEALCEVGRCCVNQNQTGPLHLTTLRQMHDH
jgi:hypothetical protein